MPALFLLWLENRKQRLRNSMGRWGFHRRCPWNLLGRMRARSRCVSTRRKWVVAAFAEGTPRKGPTLSAQFTHAGPPGGRRAPSPVTMKKSATPLRNSGCLFDFRDGVSVFSQSLAWTRSTSLSTRQAIPSRPAPLLGKMRCRRADRAPERITLYSRDPCTHPDQRDPIRDT